MDVSEVLLKLLNLEKNLQINVLHNEKQKNRDVEQLLAATRESIHHNSRIEIADTSVNAVIDLMWEECNTGHWSTVPETPKNYYAYASYLKVILCLLKASVSFGSNIELIREAIRTADFGLMLGRGCEEELSCAATLLSTLVALDLNCDRVTNSRCKEQLSTNDDSFLHRKNAIPLKRVTCPSVEDFNSRHFIPRSPIVLTGCLNHWPALSKWNDLNYLVRVAGQRTVPVEIGSSYTQNDWGVDLISLEDFIRRHILSVAPKVGYLAQHQLFDQIPELRKDIAVPDYCCLSDSDKDDFDVSINAWFGPANTLTPLHYDPKHNFLCQVVGAKRILLYSPSDSELLYPHDENMLNNTSKVDPYNPDLKSFPRFENAVAYYCTIQPGDMLYIPPKWWHHVESLDTSFSVSFWWE